MDLPAAKTGEEAHRPDWARFVMALLFNAIPLAGVAFWGWSPFALIFLYWLENVVIGVRTLAMILLSGRFHGYAAAAPIALFFTFHYGIFCAVHGVFVITLFGGEFSGQPADLWETSRTVAVGVIAIVIWQSALLVLHVTRGDESDAMTLMATPYPRIVALHVTILAGGMLLMWLGWPHAGVLVLALVKTLMDAALALGRPFMGAADDAKAAGVSPPSARSRP